MYIYAYTQNIIKLKRASASLLQVWWYQKKEKEKKRKRTRRDNG